MNLKEKLELLVQNKPPKKIKPPKVREPTAWEDAAEKVFPGFIQHKLDPKTSKILEAIVEKIDRETSVSSNEFLYWYMENIEIITGLSYPSVGLFIKSYKEPLAKFIKSKEKKSLRVRR